MSDPASPDDAAPKGASLSALVEVMETLLGPEGCPWDKEQTLETLRPYVLEEAFEVVEAIDGGKPAALKEELGDLLFQIVFQSALAERAGDFDVDDVVHGIEQKMIRRHPWVFGDERQEVDGGAKALARWEEQKAKEKGARVRERGALGGVPVALPALLRAHRVGEKAAAVGYDWPDSASVRAKVDEELAELDRAESDADFEAELGDLLFALVSLGRKRGVDAESALRGTLDRFSKRFRHAELAAADADTSLRDLDDAARDELWEQAKAATAQGGGETS